MDILIVEEKLINGYNYAVGYGSIKAPKIGEKAIINWKADPIHTKSNSSDEDDD